MANDINKYKLNVDEPELYKRRSYISNLKHSSHFTFNSGDLVPMDSAWAVLPGDTWKLRQSTLIRMTNPPKTPTMDQLVVDYYYFYTPYRVLDYKWNDFITGNKGTQWNDLSTETSAYMYLAGSLSGAGTYEITNSLFHYLHCLPAMVTVGATGGSNRFGYFQAYPVMNYYRIWNEYFRVEYLQAEIAGTYLSSGRSAGGIEISTVLSGLAGYRTTYGVGLTNPPTLGNGVLCPVNRLGDYFTTALPVPQKGGDTLLDLSIPASISSGLDSVRILTTSGASAGGDFHATQNIAYNTSYDSVATDIGSLYNWYGFTSLQGGTVLGLRQAFAIDYIKTLDARYGQRITEFTKAHFNVIVPDSRVPRPEFLGKRRFYFNINQVIQSSETGSTPQGNAGAWGQSLDRDAFLFTKSFTEYGLIQGVICVRVLNHSYAQGMDKQFSKFNRFDYYIPALANISDLPIYKDEIYLGSMNSNVTLSQWKDRFNSNIFGYQEPWAEYKYMPNRVAGLLDPQASSNLAIWTYTDYYANAPVLSSTWVQEPINNIDNTLMIPSMTAPQFIADCFFDIDAYRCMPVHALPGGLTNAW